MTASLAQQEQSAYRLLRNAYALGFDDDAAIAWTVQALGKDAEALIGRVWAREFKSYGGAG